MQSDQTNKRGKLKHGPYSKALQWFPWNTIRSDNARQEIFNSYKKCEQKKTLKSAFSFRRKSLYRNGFNRNFFWRFYFFSALIPRSLISPLRLRLRMIAKLGDFILTWPILPLVPSAHTPSLHVQTHLDRKQCSHRNNLLFHVECFYYFLLD